METFSKVSAEKLSISTPVEVITVEKTLEELEADLKQAQDSLAYIQSKHAEEIASTQATVDIMQKRVDEATKVGITKSMKDAPIVDAGLEVIK